MNSEEDQNGTVKEGDEATPSGCAATAPSPPAEKQDMLFGVLPTQDLLLYAKAAAGLAGAYFVVAPQHFLSTVWNVLLTALGITLGVGLGAGLAAHVFHQLQSWQEDYDQRGSADEDKLKRGRRRSSLEQIRPRNRHSILRGDNCSHTSVNSLNGLAASASATLEDGNSYATLMAQAGYPVPDRVLRGQVLREDHKFWKVKYRFTDDIIPEQRAVRLIEEEWPSLPQAVTREMGRFIEHVMRDYISGWYSSLDSGVIYRDEREKREGGIPRDGGDNDERYFMRGSAASETTSSLSPRKRPSIYRRESTPGIPGVAAGTPQKFSQLDPATTTTPSISSSLTSPSKNETSVLSPSKKQTGQNQKEQPQNPHVHIPRNMVFSTLTHRRAPLIDCTYRVMSAVFGNLASRAEHVNVAELAVLKWTQVLGRSLKVYRTLRKAAQEKDHAEIPTEVQVTREFLLAGKLHRAVVFGLDVPSLLFADASGEECGCGTDQAPRGQLHVLQQRLYHTNMLKECELDYNRVVANRLVRALLPKSESTSQCVMALLVEIIAGSVLQPLMNLWVPSFLNDIIVKTMGKPAPAGIGSDDVAETMATDSKLNTSSSSSPADPKTTDNLQFVAESMPISTASARDLDGSHRVESVGLAAQRELSVQSIDASVTELPDELLTMTCAPTELAIANLSTSSDSDDSSEPMEVDGIGAEPSSGDKLMTLLSRAVTELSKYMDFDKCRYARQNNLETEIDWDDADVGSAVLRLVMVIETVLLDGRCVYREPLKENQQLDLEGVGIPEDDFEGSERRSFSLILMEMTSNMNAFEKRISEYDKEHPQMTTLIDHPRDEFEPNANEISTVRTLISTWLHTGQLFKAATLITQAAPTLLAPFYASDAFVVEQVNRETFLEHVKVFDGVDVMVETMAVLASQRLMLEEEFDMLVSATEPSPPSGLLNNASPSQRRRISNPDHGHIAETNMISLTGSYGGQSTHRYLDFHRNEAFAASLRAERERRLRAWETTKADDSIMTVLRKTAIKKIDLELHRELHRLAFVLSNGTSSMSIRDAARKTDPDNDEASNSTSNEKVSLLTVETAAARRRIEVPDDDSSFLLRAQSRPLNPVSVHRDDRNHDMSYKCFLATYEEPAIAHGSTRYSGGRFVRRCFLQYYPSDRTASIVPTSDARKLDKRKGKPVANDEVGKDLAGTFLRQRHFCQKWSQRGGASTQSFFDSKLMDPGDFVSAPRSGKAIDFVYKKILFEPPVIDLAGKRFTVQDSSSGRGVHRADASALEVSDASLSHLLLFIGKEYEAGKSGDPVESGPDGYPMVFQKVVTKHGDQVSSEIKPYRLSFVRAALMIASSRYVTVSGSRDNKICSLGLMG